jgi:hypothetical protein
MRTEGSPDVSQAACQICGGDHPTEAHAVAETLQSILLDGEEINTLDLDKNIDSSVVDGENRQAMKDDISDSALAQFLREKIDSEEKKEPGKLRAFFQGKPILDLGAGSFHDGYECAQRLGASCYVAVEPYFANHLLRSLQRLSPENRTIPYMVVKQDGLSALKSLKDGSINVMTVATDSLMLRDPKYNAELNDEISRVVGDGAFIGYDTVLFPKDFSKERIDRYAVIGLRKS